MKNKSNITKIFIVALFILIVAFVLSRPINKVINYRDVTVIVTDKAVKRNNGDDTYLIYTEDKYGDAEVFEITDSFLANRWDSSDLYASIKIGGTYKFTIAGSRIHFLSWYPNIYEAEKIS